MSFSEHRKKLLDAMAPDSLAVCYAGRPLHANEDDYYEFIVNSQFFWLTGLEREGMILLLAKTDAGTAETLFIEQADPTAERWTGKMPVKEDAKAVSGIEDIRYLEGFTACLDRYMNRSRIRTVYFDVFRNGSEDLPDLNAVKASAFAAKYPAVRLQDLHEAVLPLRRIKDSMEIGRIREAVDLTRRGLEQVMSTLRPGMKEYQVQTIFEASCRYNGAEKMAFGTIAGSGINGCMMHYRTNHCTVPDDGLILLDLGAKYENYCSDITRTYPVSGRYSPRQRQYYELVLKANRAVAAAAKPGVTLKELNELTKQILAEGLTAMGKISSPDQVGKYYMHSVSHSIGIDVHDINLGTDPLQPGWVISDEPGLYIDEEEIGIRIEDDLLITEDGCEVLSQAILRDPDEIEAFMAAHKA